MTLTVLQVAYPLAPVAPETAGGAEQILLQLDRALVERGHRSLVIACEGSRVFGRLIPTPAPPSVIDETAKKEAQRAQAARLRNVLARYPIDLVHMHGVDFYEYLPREPVPTLVTLHLPLSWYPQDALRCARPNLWFHCVSDAQHATAPKAVNLLPPIPNGVRVAGLPRRRKRRFALFLGRICPEKGVHLAMQAAELAGIPLLIAGQTFGYEAHQRYFEREVAPRLSRRCRFLGPVGLARKYELLNMAGYVLIPSLAEETSSLVAREALAAGTPVIAFARGALPEAVEHGRTGFLVSSVEEMARAIGRASTLDPAVCREEAKRRFPIDKMLDRYIGLYRSVTAAAALERASA